MPAAPPAAESPPVGLGQQLRELDSRFWIVNVMEMFERLAYYGVRTVVPLYMVLPLEQGGPQFTHEQKGVIFAWWAGVQAILPSFTGGYADRYGHKNTVAVAIALKVVGYLMMAQFKDYAGFFAGCLFLAAGTAVFKPGVQGTLAATLKQSNASVGWGIFYQLVNVGGFLGPALAGVLRLMDWKYVFWSCAVIVSINLAWLPFYADPTHGKQPTAEMSSALKVLTTSIKGLFRPRVFIFCIAFSGFWFMFNQVFDLLPNYIDDWVDSSDMLAGLGQAFAVPGVPLAVAVGMGALLGGVVWAMAWLATRPDRRPAAAVGRPGWAVVGLALGVGLWIALALQDERFSSPAALLLIPVVMAVSTPALAALRPDGGRLALALGGLSAAGCAVGLTPIFLRAGEQLQAMAAAGEQVNPEWMLNVNAGLITFTMVFFGWLTSFVRPLTSIIGGMLVATLGAIYAGGAVSGWACVAGIAVFSIGEMLSSPKKMEYMATLSPKGQEGLFMGYANIPVAIGWIAGSLYAGERYDRDGDRTNLALRYLQEERGWTREAAEALERSQVLETLARELGRTPEGARELLFTTYRPDQIWVSIAITGVISLVAMVFYDRALRWYDGRAARQVAG